MPIYYPISISGDAITSLSLTQPTTIVSGSVLYVSGTTGNAQLADQDGVGTREVIGIALETPSSTTVKTATRFGSTIPVKFVSPPTSSAQIGSAVYLSSTAGQATMTVPTIGTVYKLGILLSNTDLGGNTYNIVFMPNKLVDL